MIRPRVTMLLPLAAVLVAGCTTFSDSDAVARVDETELLVDDLGELSTAIDPGYDPTDADFARQAISIWIEFEAVKAELERSGIVVTDEEIDAATSQLAGGVAGFSELPDRTRDYLVGAVAARLAFSALPPPSVDDVVAAYDGGIAASGVACTAHILVETNAEADEIRAELEAGADFSELATARSIDPGSAAAGGLLQCLPADRFAGSFVPPFVEAALIAPIGVATEPVRSDFGYHIILVRPLDEVRPELPGVVGSEEFRVARAIDAVDVYVAPRYGALRGLSVVPLS